eukprot:1875267-Amphidinium_carterae.1
MCMDTIQATATHLPSHPIAISMPEATQMAITAEPNSPRIEGRTKTTKERKQQKKKFHQDSGGKLVKVYRSCASCVAIVL